MNSTNNFYLSSHQCRHYGFLFVDSIETIGNGMLPPGERGFAVVPIEYKAIVFRPFTGQVLDGVVTQVNKVSIFIITV